MKTIVLGIAAALATAPAFAKTSCDEVKAQIDAKLEKKGVKNYTIEAVDPKDVGDKRVVGSCEGGAKKLVYKRGKG